MLALQQHYDQEWDNGRQIIYCYIPFYEFAMSFIGMHARKMRLNSYLIMCQVLLKSVRAFGAVLYCKQLKVDPPKLRIQFYHFSKANLSIKI